MKNTILALLIFSCTVTFGQEITPAILKKINASEHKLDVNNGDGVFLAKNKETKKWGMYQAWSDKDITEMIPPQYDSIDFFGFNSRFTGVWKNGKVGIYLSTWSFNENARQTIACKYEAYKVYNFDNRKYPYLAVKKEGKWGWVDWLTGKERSYFYEELVAPFHEQTLDAETPLKELNKNFQGFENVKKKQDPSTKKWGLVEIDENKKEIVLIPSIYDSVDFFNEEGQLAGVYQNGKVGIYTSPWIFGEKARQTTECKYDDYKIFQVFKPLNNQTKRAVSYVAVKMGDYWYWLDWHTGVLKQEEGMYNLDIEDMSFPEFEQEN